jgi:hypothetical protein
MEMDQLTEANAISNEVEMKDFVACPNGEMTKQNEEKERIMPETPVTMPKSYHDK